MKYEVKYSGRRTISLEITKEATLLVRAPYKTEKSKIEKTIQKHLTWINKHLERMQKRVDATPSLTQEDILLLKKQARQTLSEMTEHFSHIMGINYGRITITSAKGRFGSCSSEGNIAYSYRIMLYPKEVQEYVVVHELSHRVHMDHSKSFYALVASVLPDYKKRAKYLKLPIGTPYE